MISSFASQSQNSMHMRLLSASLFVLAEDGRLFMWGDNSVGQIGLGEEGFAAQPRKLNVEDAVIWVSCGYHHSAFVTGIRQSSTKYIYPMQVFI